jgi:MAF protein
MHDTQPQPTIILASASPRRHELFALLEVPFRVQVADVDEAPLPDEAPAETAARLSHVKARAVAEGLVNTWVVAADTVVALGEELLGKPADADEATSILRRLRRRAHQVITGMTIMRADGGDAETLAVTTDVWMRDYTGAEIQAYVASGDPMDKAGAYAIQHAGFAPVQRLVGCPANVMGLPVCQVHALLSKRGVGMPRVPAARCRPAESRCAIREVVVPD